MKGRTITISKRARPHAEKWLRENSQASAGPYPSITGMRNIYWGRDALIVKCGSYIYYFGKDRGQELNI